jgi:hypothetical protein
MAHHPAYNNWNCFSLREVSSCEELGMAHDPAYNNWNCFSLRERKTSWRSSRTVSSRGLKPAAQRTY